ncbi:UPF0729 protein C18orf32 homolog [Polyodon spathula]|uniref:UPF0729 protein C18orf32 homolog n=1 Tax=Polyodon spathula TaxID=7913 RepID=UPI001B7EAF3D|nr:UPF0729 protein C18orf32 homolog [Polyodon spathula]XP_041090451.1 UPF0729 protein C18orf32 homolog [Polyodon spathula]
MVCIPCIVIPVLLWIYKKFLEPIIYPFISPFISRMWPNKSVLETGTATDHPTGQSNGTCKMDSPVQNGTAAKGPSEVSDKKTD